jgi:hypothetical protein
MKHAGRFLALIVSVLTLAMVASPVRAADVVMDFSNNTGLGYAVGTSQTITQNGIRMQALAGKYEITHSSELNLKDFDVGPRTVQFDLLSGKHFDFLGFSRQDAWGNATITSDRGGNLTFSLGSAVDFCGPEWKDLSWIRISASQTWGEFKFNWFRFRELSTLLMDFSNNTGLGYSVGTSQTITQNGIRMQALAGKYEITYSSEMNLKDFDVGPRTVQFDLLSGNHFDFLGFSRQDAYGDATITSDRGGTLTFSLWSAVDFSGPEWKDLSWIRISASQTWGEFKFNWFRFRELPTLLMDFTNHTGLGYAVGTSETITQNGIRMQALAGKYEITRSSELNLKDFGVGQRTVQFDLLSGTRFDFLGFSRQDAYGGATITSDRGGTLDFSLWSAVDFSGQEWKDLSWIRISASQKWGEFKFNWFKFQESTNSTPILGPIGDRILDELTELSLNLSATDSDTCDSHTFSIAGGSESGMTLNASTGIFSWTPTEAQGFGVYTVIFRVTDNGSPVRYAQESIQITVNEVNLPPVLGAIGNRSVDEETPLSFVLTATDPDGNTLAYSIVSGSETGMTLNASTGAFSWTPAEAQGPGTYDVTFRVTDNGVPALYDEETIQITVNEVNLPPVLGAIGNRSVDEGTELSFDLTATDPDGNTLAYSIVSGSQPGMTLNASTGTFSWTPTEAQGPGTYDVTFRVTDNGVPAFHDEETIQITVHDANRPPVLGTIGNRSVDEETELSFGLTATDPEGNTLTYSIVSGSQTGMTLNASTGAFSWTPTEAQGPGTYDVTFRVTDDGSPVRFDEEVIQITVHEVNLPPVLGAIGNQSTQWGDQLSFSAAAIDPDNPANSLAFSLQPGSAGATIDVTSGAFSWTPDPASIGTHSLTVTVSDGSLSDSETFDVEVTKRNPGLTYDGATAGECTDTVTLSATLKRALPPVRAGRTIDFVLGTQFASETTDSGGVGSTTMQLAQSPGVKTLDSSFDGDGFYFASSDNKLFTIEPEGSVSVEYIGELFVSTSCTTCPSAAVTLVATVTEGDDGSTGDVRNATVSFVDRNKGNAVLCSAKVGLIDPSDTTVGTATCRDISLPEGNYLIGIIVSGCYGRNASTDDFTLTISKPEKNSVSGGGYLLLTDSNGIIPGTPQSKNHFGFNVKYNKSGKNLQGTMNVIVRSGGIVYQVKGTAISSLTVNTSTAGGHAIFYSKAALLDITNPENPISIDGNATLQVSMTDNGQGVLDTIAITVFDKNGGLWFSSNWTGVRSVEQLIAGGNLQVQ